VAVADDWFVSLDTDIRPTIAEDGSIDMGGLLELTDAAPSDAGARLGPNPDPTVIELLPPVGGDDGEDDQCGKPPWAGGPGGPPWAGGPGGPPWAGGPGGPPWAGDDCDPGNGGPGNGGPGNGGPGNGGPGRGGPPPWAGGPGGPGRG